MSNKENVAKNWEVVKRELEDYQIQITVVLARVRRTEGWQRKLHHLSGLGPDIHRLMPRTLWYSSVVLTAAAVLVVAVYLAY